MGEKLPRLVAQVDVRQFKLDAMDGFLLTRIDGRLGKKELARETGLPEFQVEKTLEKLEKLGVIEIVDPDAPVTHQLPPPPARDRTQLPQFASLGGEAKYDPKELEEEIDLSLDQKTRVLDMYYRLDDLDHYTLLGVGKEADKKTVKRSYFELASLMHPDRYFKKKLGSFKGKMEVLFGRITEAHDTLVDAAKRLDYDAYLDEVATTKGMEAMFERALEESRKASEAAASAAAAAPMAAPVPSAPAAPTGPSAAEIQARRETLARRLLGGQAPRPGAKAPSKPPEPANPLKYANTGDAMDALKRRYEERIENATTAQSRKYVEAADTALSKNDFVAAASALHIASRFAPEDTGLALRYQEVKLEADKLLCDSYEKQANYEEKSQHYAEAARSWAKVAKVKVNDARANSHAARCLLETDGSDLHKAAEHAKVAITAEPMVVNHHIVLAEIYAKAGLTASAKRAAEAGLGLDPKNAHLTALIAGKKAPKAT